MSQTITLQLERPIRTVRISDNTGSGRSPGLKKASSLTDVEQTGSPQALDIQRGEYSDVCRILKVLVDKLNQFHDKIFAEHKEEIAKFSVEIARKILVQKVEDGNYEIESIVKEALSNSPTRQDVVVHLNPKDLAKCRKLQESDESGDLSGVKFVADSNIERAECLLESPKGIIESAIDEQLERIAEALKKVK